MKYNKQEYKLKLMNKYLYHLEILKNLNRIIYNSTEFFENKKMIEYNFKQWKYFSKRLTRYGKDINELNNLLNDDEKIDINRINLKRSKF